MALREELERLFPKVEEISTGGGCMALCIPCDDGTHLELSDGDDHVPTDDDTNIVCAVFDGMTQVECSDHIAVGAVIQWINSKLVEHRKLPEVDALADALISRLRDAIGEEKFGKVVAGTHDPDDFCDANMIMDAAFKSLGVDPLPDLEKGMSQAICDRWNAAWDRAIEKMRIDALSAELNAYLASKGIPPACADDILAMNKGISADVHDWLLDFGKRWDAAQGSKKS